MYFNPPQNNHNDFYHPLNKNLNEEKQFKARVAFMGEPKDNARDMRAAGRMKMYDTATERDVPSKRKSTVFDITFKSERQFNQFMGAYDVEFLDRLDESRDDFDYLDAQAASEDRAIAGKKFMDALKKAGIKAEYVRSSGTMRVAKKDLRKAQGIGKKLKVDRDGVRMDVLREDVQLDEVTGETTVMAKGDRNQYERITRALTAAKKEGKIDGYEGAHYNFKTKVLTLIFDSKAHKPASQRRKVAKMIKDFGLEFSHSIEEAETPFRRKILSAQDKLRKAGIKSAFQFGEVYVEKKDLKKAEKLVGGDKEVLVVGVPFLRKDEIDEGFASDAQRRAAFASGYKAKGKKKKKNEEEEVEEIEEGAKFSKSQLDTLKREYGKLNKIDVTSPTYKKLTDKMDSMTDEQLLQIHNAGIKFMRGLAVNRLVKRGVKIPK